MIVGSEKSQGKPRQDRVEPPKGKGIARLCRGKLYGRNFHLSLLTQGAIQWIVLFAGSAIPASGFTRRRSNEGERDTGSERERLGSDSGITIPAPRAFLEALLGKWRDAVGADGGGGGSARPTAGSSPFRSPRPRRSHPSHPSHVTPGISRRAGAGGCRRTRSDTRQCHR